MATFMEATRVKNSLKMKLSQQSWFRTIGIEYKSSDGFCVVVYTDKIDDMVKKVVPQLHEDVDIILETK